jgi:hypothetical protein
MCSEQVIGGKSEERGLGVVETDLKLGVLIYTLTCTVITGGSKDLFTWKIYS